MSNTLAQLRRTTLRALRRPTTRYNGSAWVDAPVDTSLDPADVTEAINSALAWVWREAGGPVPDTYRANLAANQRDYLLPAQYAFVQAASVLDTAGGALRPIARASSERLPRLYQDYPDTVASGLSPRFYTVRPFNVAGTSGAVLSLFPAPPAPITSGLVLQVGLGASTLAAESDETFLPDVAAKTACWKAALDLLPFLADDPRTAGMAPTLEKQVSAGLTDTIRAVIQMFGGVDTLTPVDNFSPCNWYDWCGGYQTDGSISGGTGDVSYFRSSIVTAAGGETAITCDTTTAVGVLGSDPMVDGENQGRIFGVTWNDARTLITATFRTNPDTGTPFTAEAGERFLFNWFSAVSS